MLRKFLGVLWRRAPRSFRRFSVRLTQPRFTVTVAAVITDERNRVLLLNHVFRPGSGWGVPGGFINKGENLEEALRRELREEIGLELGKVEFRYARALKTTAQVEVIFRAEPKGLPQSTSVEITGLGWFELDSLPLGIPPSQKQIIEWALADGAPGPP
jgi:ADP-ribose pyrophosphatase YjhB (NUDIX family)